MRGTAQHRGTKALLGASAVLRWESAALAGHSSSWAERVPIEGSGHGLLHPRFPCTTLGPLLGQCGYSECPFSRGFSLQTARISGARADGAGQEAIQVYRSEEAVESGPLGDSFPAGFPGYQCQLFFKHCVALLPGMRHYLSWGAAAFRRVIEGCLESKKVMKHCPTALGTAI